jgi:hypothetical protein
VVVTTIWEAIGPFQAVAIALITAATLAVLRLITPTVRWNRRLKEDGGIFSSLPEGTEKEMWRVSVTAQAERLRLYRENFSIGEQFVAWYALIALVLTVIALITEAVLGWPVLRTLEGGDIVVLIPFMLLGVINFVFATYISVRLILGYSISFRNDGKGHYPKYAAMQHARKRRLWRRGQIAKRLAVLQSSEERARKSAER